MVNRIFLPATQGFLVQTPGAPGLNLIGGAAEDCPAAGGTPGAARARLANVFGGRGPCPLPRPHCGAALIGGGLRSDRGCVRRLLRPGRRRPVRRLA